MDWHPVLSADGELSIKGHKRFANQATHIKNCKLRLKKIKRPVPIHDKNGCWIWPRAKNKTGGGYGQFYYRGNSHLAHRIYYQLFKGTIPGNHDIHHLCNNPACVNPDHLEALSRAEHRYQHRDQVPYKLNWDAVRDIRCSYATGNFTYQQLGDIYDVSRESVRQVIKFETWKKDKPLTCVS